jgi:hypothetical protein
VAQQPTSPETGTGPSPKQRPWSSSWVNYYDQASRRRHRLGGYKRLREQARRKKLVELVAMTCAGAGVLALVAVFYTILSR